MPLIAAYIVPHPPLAVHEVGLGQEREIACTLRAYDKVARSIVDHAPESIVFVSPHSAYYGDWIYLASGDGASGDFGQFGAPQVRFSLEYDRELTELIIASSQLHDVPAGHVEGYPRTLDHGIMVPMYFIKQAQSDKKAKGWHFQSVSVGGSALPKDKLLEFGRCIVRAIDMNDKDVVLVVSGDLSHKLTKDGPYGYDPAGPAFDETFKTIVESGDLMQFAVVDPAMSDDAAECGLSGFVMLAGALDEASQRGDRHFSSALLCMEGPFGVGYGVAAFENVGTAEKEDSSA